MLRLVLVLAALTVAVPVAAQDDCRPLDKEMTEAAAHEYVQGKVMLLSPEQAARAIQFFSAALGKEFLNVKDAGFLAMRVDGMLFAFLGKEDSVCEIFSVHPMRQAEFAAYIDQDKPVEH